MKIIGLSIYQRESDGRWIGAIELPSTNGKRNRKTVSAKTEKEVKRKANKLVYEIESGDYVEPSKDSLIAFLKKYHKINAGCDMWKEDYVYPENSSWALSTAELNQMYIDVHLEPYFKDKKLVDVKPMDLDEFYNYKLTTPREYDHPTINGKIYKKVQPPLSNNTVLKLNTFFKSAFNYAVKNDLLKTNPTDRVTLKKKKKFIPTIYSEQQFMELLNYVENTDDEIPILLAGGCGLRRGEMFGLYWRNIDFDTNNITIMNSLSGFRTIKDKDTKNESSERMFEVPDYIMDILREYMKKANGKENEKVITRWKPKTYTERFGQLLERFDMPHIRLHDLRHYNAVIMMKYGVPDKVAAERLGHSQITTLRDVYQHVTKDLDKRAADDINKMFNKEK